MITLHFVTPVGWPRSVEIHDPERCLDLLADFVSALEPRTRVAITVGERGVVYGMWTSLVTRELRLAAMSYVVTRESAQEAA